MSTEDAPRKNTTIEGLADAVSDLIERVSRIETYLTHGNGPTADGSPTQEG